jgi:hypothetical protein
MGKILGKKKVVVLSRKKMKMNEMIRHWLIYLLCIYHFVSHFGEENTAEIGLMNR